MERVTLGDIRAAEARISGQVLRTPLLPGPREIASHGQWMWVKPESLQPTGAVKIRGAINAISLLAAERRRAGVVTFSSGNHGRALAYAARSAGIPVMIIVPDTAPPGKVVAIGRLGGRVRVVPAGQEGATAHHHAEISGMELISPIDHPAVIAGQGTAGLEILADLPDVEQIVVPLGAGALVSGIAVAVKTLRPTSVRVVAVEPELAGVTAEGFRLGRQVFWSPELTGRTVADGARIKPSAVTFGYIRRLVDEVSTVSEQEISRAVAVLATGCGLVAEPTGALAVAWCLARPELARRRTVAIVSGRNAQSLLTSEYA